MNVNVSYARRGYLVDVLYMTVEETLKVFGNWLCGKCMTLHAVSRTCHHPDGLVYFSKGSDDMSNYIVAISKPSNTEVIEGLVLDAELLDRVFKVLPDSIDALVRFITYLHDHRCSYVSQQNRTSNVGENNGQHQHQALRQCIHKLAVGHFTSTVKVLSSSGVALYYDDTIKALEAKHPYKPPLSMPSNTFYEPPLVAEINSVVGCIKSFPKGTSCGRDGLRAQHILDALCGGGLLLLHIS
ncbi:hypothetical protein Tco_0363853 [Tanacetum coccineum]